MVERTELRGRYIQELRNIQSIDYAELEIRTMLIQGGFVPLNMPGATTGRIDSSKPNKSNEPRSYSQDPHSLKLHDGELLWDLDMDDGKMCIMKEEHGLRLYVFDGFEDHPGPLLSGGTLDTFIEYLQKGKQ